MPLGFNQLGKLSIRLQSLAILSCSIVKKAGHRARFGNPRDGRRFPCCGVQTPVGLEQFFQGSSAFRLRCLASRERISLAFDDTVLAAEAFVLTATSRARWRIYGTCHTMMRAFGAFFMTELRNAFQHTSLPAQLRALFFLPNALKNKSASFRLIGRSRSRSLTMTPCPLQISSIPMALGAGRPARSTWSLSRSLPCWECVASIGNELVRHIPCHSCAHMHGKALP